MEGLAEMKSAEEWICQWFHENVAYNFKDLVTKIQSDAFHAGKLAGLNEAREIVQKHGENEVAAINDSLPPADKDRVDDILQRWWDAKDAENEKKYFKP